MSVTRKRLMESARSALAEAGDASTREGMRRAFDAHYILTEVVNRIEGGQYTYHPRAKRPATKPRSLQQAMNGNRD